MSNLQKKSDNFKKSVARLQEALEEYELNKSTTVRDGVIQRFEFCVELAWKTTREYLLEQGFLDLNSPKAVMREAYSYKIINNEQAWIQILNDRNLTSHVYDEKTADEIFLRICTSHLPSLRDLSIYLCEE
ncbi:nucleotidyltransferase substrate binding protein [Anaerotignum propionicum]|uniref:nucleotidyltransferase substrate binding protein n=1 Tax=Anaerotignum propionicum TaxID=28446 RepID=UPI002899B48A|nr:nucleotidyltransferase substrate binding protein [Anaerotignum propionicum]